MEAKWTVPPMDLEDEDYMNQAEKSKEQFEMAPPEEHSVLVPKVVVDLTKYPELALFYTAQEARAAAASIGWDKSSARRLVLPFGRLRYGISDDHGYMLTSTGMRSLLDACNAS